MCHDRSWFLSQEQKKAQDRTSDMKDKRRSETVNNLLRESTGRVQEVDANRVPAREPTPAK